MHTAAAQVTPITGTEIRPVIWWASLGLLCLLLGIIVLSTLYIDPFPETTPTWLRNEMCGKGTDYECPARDVHVPLPGSGPLPPYTGRL